MKKDLRTSLRTVLAGPEMRGHSALLAAANKVVLQIDDKTIVLKERNGSGALATKTETPLNLIYDATELLSFVEAYTWPEIITPALKAASQTLLLATHQLTSNEATRTWAIVNRVLDVVSLLGVLDYRMQYHKPERPTRYAIKCARHALEDVQRVLRSYDFDRVAKEAARG